MPLKIVLINLMVFLSFMSFGQNKSEIRGRVTSNNQPLEFVSIGLKNTNLGTNSDENGNYSIGNVPSGTYTLIVSSIGYERQTKTITVSNDESGIVYNFNLIESSQSLNEVVVSGTMMEVNKLESAVPVEVYSDLYFKANPAPSVFESLQNVNGVRPQLNCNVCNTGDIHINGLEGPYTMVLIDGMPIVSGLSTVYGLTGIPQALIERIEIVKGPASTLYGSEAVGGIVNVITKKPGNAPRISLDAFASDWGEVNSDLGLRYDLGSKVQGLTGVNYFNYQSPIDNNGDNFTDLTLQDRISVFNKINILRKDNKTFTVAGRYVYEDRWGGEMQWERENRGGTDVYGESIYTKRWEAFGTYQLPTAEIINFQLSANGHHQNSVYGTDWYIAKQYVGFGQLTWNKPVGNHNFLSGIAYRYTHYDDNTPATFDAEQNDNEPSNTFLPGAFVQDEVTLNETNKLLLGMRYDHNSRHGSIFTPRINYKWNTPDKKNVIRISAGNGYRVANVFTEDHAALTGARDVVFEGSLKPETSWNTNINYVRKFYTKGSTYIGLDMSAFYTYFTNRILPDYETNPNQIIYSNLEGSSVSKGVSVNIDANWLNGFKILTGATLMDVTVEEDGRKFRQLLTESFQGVWSIGYTFEKIKLALDYTGNLYGPMRLPLLGENDDRPEFSPWWSIQNIQLTKSFGDNWEVYGGVKNLLNFTPAKNSIARSFDPFDEGVDFYSNGAPLPTDALNPQQSYADGDVIATTRNPTGLTFDPSYVYASNQGIRGFLGVRYRLK